MNPTDFPQANRTFTKPERQPGEGAFYWRKELQRRAALARPRSEETPTSPCGHIDEGWEEFPCTLPAGHEGKHACTATVTLTTVATDKETP